MRASDVREAIKVAVEAVDPDHQATAVDRFLVMEVGQIVDDMVLQDRMAVIILDQPPRRFPGLMIENRYVATWRIQIAYRETSVALERIAQDSERVQWALEGLTVTETDIAVAEVVGVALDEGDGLVGLFIEITIQYRLTGL